jgi:hypothetical protein
MALLARSSVMMACLGCVCLVTMLKLVQIQSQLLADGANSHIADARQNAPHPVQVHIIPHSHVDPGWRETVDR